MGNNIDDAYKKGAEDAWEAAKKIVLNGSDGGLSIYELQDIFGFYWCRTIFEGTTALDAIGKIRKYEKRNEFQVGDEVSDGRFYAVVARISVNNNPSKMFLVFSDGSTDERDKEGWKKTGRFFPQIADVLNALDEAMKKECSECGCEEE